MGTTKTIEFINARTGEVIDTVTRPHITFNGFTGTIKQAAHEHAGLIARENGDDIYIRWEAGAGAEGDPDTLVTFEEANR